MKQSSKCLLIIIVYVDDLIIMASTLKDMEELKALLMKKYEMTDLGELHYCLGIEFKRNRTLRTISLNQRKFIEQVLQDFGMQDCKPIGTPLDMNCKLVKLSEDEVKKYEGEMKGIPYKQAVGSLMYAMVGTRPDLAFP